MKNISVRDLETKGFVSVPYPVNLRNAVSKTVRSWKKFCALPESAKAGLPYSNGGAGVGYEMKKGSGPKGDYKENCDLTVGGREWLEENAGKIHDQAAIGFVRDAVELVEVIKPLIVDFARRIEETFKLVGFLREVEESKDAFFIRFIHYFGNRKNGEETASAHADQSGFTLHLFESAKGLQCLTLAGACRVRWTDMPVSEGQTVIIPSMQMQLRTKGEVGALCHRVVATPKTAKEGRFSAVCFVQLKHTPKYDKEAFGRLQEKIPGFNYLMPHGEFSKMFK